jgi:hypothetical protein
VPVIVGRRETYEKLPCAMNAPKNCRMCEVGVKENEGQRTFSLRLLILSNFDGGCVDCNRRIKACAEGPLWAGFLSVGSLRLRMPGFLCW